MREFYKKQFSKVVLSSIFLSIIMVTPIDWKVRAKDTFSLIDVINGGLMSYIEAILLVELFILNLRYFSMLKERREGELLYTLPIPRWDLFLRQWKANMITIVVSWLIPIVCIGVFGSLSKIEVGNLLLSFVSYMLVSAGVISFLLWLETKLQTRVAVGGTLLALLIAIPIFLRTLSSALVVGVGSLKVGFYPWLKNIVYTFLYSRQYTNLALIEMRKNGQEISQFVWLNQGYYFIFLVVAILLVAAIAFFTISAKKHSFSFPYAKNAKKNFYKAKIVIIFMGVYSIVTNLVYGSLETFQSLSMSYNFAGGFFSQYYFYFDDSTKIKSNYGSFFLSLALSIILTAVIAVILKKKEIRNDRHQKALTRREAVK